MYQGNCATKLETTEQLDLKPEVINSWLKKYQFKRVNANDPEQKGFVMDICWALYGQDHDYSLLT